MGEEEVLGKDEPRAVLSLAANEIGAGDFEDALERIRRIQPALAGDPALYYPSCALEARALSSLGRGREALEVLDRALEGAREAKLEGHVTGLSGMRERLEQALEMRGLAAASAEEIERTTPDLASRAVLFANKIMALVAMGDVAGAKALLPRARGAAEMADEPGALLPVLLATAQLCVATDDIASARRALEGARSLAERFEPEALSLIDEMAGFLLQDPDA